MLLRYISPLICRPMHGARGAWLKPRLSQNSNVDEIFDVLQHVGRPLTAYQILHALDGTAIRSPVQVYRALSKLAGLGKVHRVESINAFVLCDGHHTTSRPGFLICTQCGTVQEFDDAAIDQLSTRLDVTGFSVATVCLEISGLCALCQAETAPC